MLGDTLLTLEAPLWTAMLHTRGHNLNVKSLMVVARLRMRASSRLIDNDNGEDPRLPSQASTRATFDASRDEHSLAMTMSSPSSHRNNELLNQLANGELR